MKYLKISNQTEIDINAFRLLGACTKRNDDSKIGYFGSGLKYAMAVLLREGIPVKIFSGLNEIEITTESETFREQNFNVISIAGHKTSLTTEMGVDWKLWQAIREIFCNALDENAPYHGEVVEIEPKSGVTSFYIQITGNEQLEAIVNNWDRYFSHKRKPIISASIGKIFPALDEHITVYRKGIRCYESPSSSLYDYDFNRIDITESRLIRYSFQLQDRLAEVWAEHATTGMIQELVDMYNYSKKSADDYYEHWADWTEYNLRFSDTWIDYFENKVLIPKEFAGWFVDIRAKEDSVILPSILISALKKAFGERIKSCTSEINSYHKYCVLPIDKRKSFLLKECMKFFEEVGLVIGYDIEVAEFEDKRILGLADNKSNKIILSGRVFDLGRKQIVCTILEETAHLDSAASDDTRAFQDYLINQIVTLLENKHAVFL